MVDARVSVSAATHAGESEMLAAPLDPCFACEGMSGAQQTRTFCSSTAHGPCIDKLANIADDTLFCCSYVALRDVPAPAMFADGLRRLCVRSGAASAVKDWSRIP
eukprot:5880770-Pyramimonas_sp.AAC.1